MTLMETETWSVAVHQFLILLMMKQKLFTCDTYQVDNKHLYQAHTALYLRH